MTQEKVLNKLTEKYLKVFIYLTEKHLVAKTGIWARSSR